MYYRLFDNMIEGVAIVNQEWEYSYVNHVFITHCRSTKEKMLNATVLGMFPDLVDTDLYSIMEKTMYDRVPTSILNYYQFQDGEATWTELRIQPVEEGLLVMTFDVTERKLMEEQIKLANQLLETKVEERTKELNSSLTREKELNKMKTSFVSMASHELKNPLSVILLSVSLIENYIGKKLLFKTDRHIGKIKDSVKQMEMLLNDFLSLGQLQKGHIPTDSKTFCIENLLREIDDSIVLERKHTQKLLYSVEGVKEIGIDKQVLRNILANLISNAFKYSDEDVEVKVVVSNFVSILVKDKGIGIPKEQKKAVFSEFFRANNVDQIEGTGLGLNIVKHYIDLLGGEISFVSEEDKGTEFKILLENKLSPYAEKQETFRF